MKATHCLNCGRSVHEKFCPQCGQKTDTHRIGWHYMLHDVPHSFLHLDKGFFYTARELSKHPGKTVRAFLDGKRVNHFRPLAYVLMLGVIMSLGIFSRPQEVSATEAIATSGVEVSDGDVTVSGDRINYVLSHYYGLLVIVCIPIYALLAWLFYKRERNYVEIITGFMFLYGHTTWFGILLILMNWIDSNAAGIALFVAWISLVFIYLMWANTSMFRSFVPVGRFFISLFIITFGFILCGIVLLAAMATHTYLTT